MVLSNSGTQGGENGEEENCPILFLKNGNMEQGLPCDMRASKPAGQARFFTSVLTLAEMEEDSRLRARTLPSKTSRHGGLSGLAEDDQRAWTGALWTNGLSEKTPSYPRKTKRAPSHVKRGSDSAPCCLGKRPGSGQAGRRAKVAWTWKRTGRTKALCTLCTLA